VTSELTISFGKKFALALLIRYPAEVRNPKAGPILLHKAARASQKKRYQTVAQLLPDHLT
jgi:hypothetical protein